MIEEKSVEDLTLYDPKLMKKTVSVSNEAMEEMINAILETTVHKSDFAVQEVMTRTIYGEGYDDVNQYIAYVQDSDGEDFEIELQVISGEDAMNRTIWYLRQLFNDRIRFHFRGYVMPRSFVIVINKEDMAGKGLPFETIITKTEGNMTPEQIKKSGLDRCFPPCIVVNGTNIDENTALGKLLQDFDKKEPDDFTYGSLARCVQIAKDNILE